MAYWLAVGPPKTAAFASGTASGTAAVGPIRGNLLKAKKMNRPDQHLICAKFISLDTQAHTQTRRQKGYSGAMRQGRRQTAWKIAIIILPFSFGFGFCGIQKEVGVLKASCVCVCECLKDPGHPKDAQPCEWTVAVSQMRMLQLS